MGTGDPHRIRNLLPTCRACKTTKGEGDFRTYLGADQARILVIEAHMAQHGYVAQSGNDRLRQILDMAHQDLRQMADRYAAIISAAL